MFGSTMSKLSDDGFWPKSPKKDSLADPSVAKIVMGVVHHKISRITFMVPYGGSIRKVIVRPSGQILNPEVLEDVPMDVQVHVPEGLSMVVSGAHGVSFDFRGYVPDLLVTYKSTDQSFGEYLWIRREKVDGQVHWTNWRMNPSISFESLIRILDAVHDI